MSVGSAGNNKVPAGSDGGFVGGLALLVDQLGESEWQEGVEARARAGGLRQDLRAFADCDAVFVEVQYQMGWDGEPVLHLPPQRTSACGWRYSSSSRKI